MPTLVAIGPVVVENVNVAKLIEVPLVDFEKKKFMDITLNDAVVRMEYNSDCYYKATVDGIRYQSEGPRWKVEP